MTRRSLYFETFLIALATILLEVSYTRVFSFKLVYYFTYLIIGIALLGLGAGGVFVATIPRLRSLRVDRVLPAVTLAAAFGVLIGYFVVAALPVNAFAMITVPPGLPNTLPEVGKLAGLCFTVFVPFLCAGLALAVIFSTQTGDINKLYGADLLGAALGCAMAIPLLSTITPPERSCCRRRSSPCRVSVSRGRGVVYRSALPC